MLVKETHHRSRADIGSRTKLQVLEGLLKSLGLGAAPCGVKDMDSKGTKEFCFYLLFFTYSFFFFFLLLCYCCFIFIFSIIFLILFHYSALSCLLSVIFVVGGGDGDGGDSLFF